MSKATRDDLIHGRLAETHDTDSGGEKKREDLANAVKNHHNEVLNERMT